MLINIIAGITTFGFTAVLTVAGLGAAFILIPVLLAMGVPLLTAMSTALLLNSIAMVIASINYAREKFIVFKTAIPIAISAMIFSPLGANTAEHLPENILKWIFICFLLFAASMILFYKPKERQHEYSTRKLIVYGIAVGTIAGFFGGLLGVGGGNFIVPFLMFLGFNAKKAAASTAFIVIFSSFAGFLGHVSLGNIDFWLLLFCVIGSISGAILGSYLMKGKMTVRQVKMAIGIVLYLVAAKMIFDLLL
jgi:uncharacterized protein